MVATRSAKRKSPESTPKRGKLPLRKKTAKGAPAEIPETDDGEDSPAEDEEVGDESLDLDAALQAQVAAENSTPIVRRSDAPRQAAGPEEDEDEDSDDEAPEAVSNVQAASKARGAADAMMKAAKEETDRLRQKRKDRDAQLKKQALTRKVKEPSPKAVSAPEETPVEAEKPTRASKPETTLLPEEFLDSDSESELDDGPAPKRRRADKKKSAAPRDKRVGDTVYRVMKEADSRMAPKSEGRSRQVRAGLAKRGREGAGTNGGFVVGPKRVDWGTSRKC